MEQRQKRCSRCAAQFPCGPAPGEERCWCDSLPPVMPMSESDCLCPQCLRQEVTARVGLCLDCRHSQRLKTKGGGVVFLCGLSDGDAGFEKYPRLHKASCAGHARA